MKSPQSAKSMPPSSALEECLRRTLRKQKRAGRDFDMEAVHDLRVALRRCRSLAEGYSSLDLDSVWNRLQRLSRKQQRGLGELRDVHVVGEWIRKLRLNKGAAGAKLDSALEREEKTARRRAERSLDSFPRKRWKRWLRRLPGRAEMIPVGSSRLAALALERLREVQQREVRWRKTHTAADWHQLRTATKRFRYTVETFLPEQHRAWARSLKRLQNVLGEGHDLDILREWIVKVAQEQSLRAAPQKQWLTRVDRARREREDQYERMISLAGRVQRVLPRQNGRSRSASLRHSSANTRTLWDRWRAKLEEIALVAKT
jgi:CHAD domain-containing protein